MMTGRAAVKVPGAVAPVGVGPDLARVVGRFEAVARELDDAVRDARSGAARSGAAGSGAAGSGSVLGGLGTVDRRRLIGLVDRAVVALTGVRGDLMVAERDSGTWRGAGDPSYEAYRGRISRAGLRAGAGQVRQAEALTTMPAIRDAASDGQISMEHVDVVARVAAGAPQAVRAVMRSAGGQAELVGIARRVDARQFARDAARWAAAKSPTAHERGHQTQRAARYLHLTDTADGTMIKGRLDSMAGHRLRLALETARPRPAADDDRSSEQRTADALSVLAEAVLTSPATTSGASVRPHVSFHLTEQTWKELRAHHVARAAGAGGQGPRDGEVAVAPGAPDIAPVTLDDGTPVPMSEVARALCDCELTRIVTDAAGEVLDLGRTARTYTGAQRRAIIARDRQCGWPDCGSTARWAEVHHMRWWDRDDGETSIENGVLLCTFHHHEIHRFAHTIVRHAGPAPGPPGASGEPTSGSPPSGSPPSGSPLSGSPLSGSPLSGSPPSGLPPSGGGEPTASGGAALVHYTVHTSDGRLVAPASSVGTVR